MVVPKYLGSNLSDTFQYNIMFILYKTYVVVPFKLCELINFNLIGTEVNIELISSFGIEVMLNAALVLVLAFCLTNFSLSVVL